MANPGLAPLGDYGGTCQTMALLPGSPAIVPRVQVPRPRPPTSRGLPRVGSVDIGAFESQGFTFTVVPGSTPQTSKIGTPFAKPLTVTVKANNPVEPVNGGIASFVAHPADNGASAIFFDPTAVIAGGQAAVIAAPNNIQGAYTVVASVDSSSFSFALTNTGQVFAALIVNSTSDSIAPGAGLLSLREAIAFNNSSPSGNSPITFDSAIFSTSQTITLTGRQLELTNTTETETITGPTVGVTIDGGGMSRVFQVDGGVTASISGLTISGGIASSGGGLANYGTTTLTNCTFSGNSAGTSGGGLANSAGGIATLYGCAITGNSANASSHSTGGGLWNSGGLALTNCTVSDNSAQYGGGGLENFHGSLELTGCTVSGNYADFGGGVNNNSGLTVSNSKVSGNVAGTGGGGVENYGGAVATLTNCVISQNSAGNNGGGLSNGNSTTMLTNCTVSGNTGALDEPYTSGFGGGVFSDLGTTTLTDCTVSDNSAGSAYEGFGGGVFGEYGTATLTDCTISGNSAGSADFGSSGGGVDFAHETATLTNCAITGNSALGPQGSGGGFQNAYGKTTLIGCTISGNFAGRLGGGVANYGGTDKLANCTVNGNSAVDYGGGVFTATGGSTALANCTVSGNSANNGGGLYNNGSSVTLSNTIVAGNTAANSGPDAFGTFTSQGNNLIGETDGSSGWVSSDLTGTVASPLDPLLGPLANNGGPTETMALLPGSPAIDAGNNSLIPSGIITDQRGYLRIYHGTVDIGAFELQPPPVSIAVSPSNPTLVEGVLVQFTAMGTFPDGETLDITDNVTWASATPSVAAISDTGLATALAPGTSQITASLEGVTSPDDTLTVVDLVSIAVSPGNPDLAEGVAGQFTATGTLADGSTLDLTNFVTWASATPSVATISGTGLATALAPGTSEITASLAGVTSPADSLTVLALVSIAVSPGNPKLAEGVAGQFVAMGTFTDGSTANITNFVTRRRQRRRWPRSAAPVWPRPWSRAPPRSPRRLMVSRVPTTP